MSKRDRPITTMTEETTANADQKPAPKGKPPAKKEKPPAPEEKPFTEFMEQDFTPTLKKALSDEGISDIEINFTQASLPLKDADQTQKCWQVIGTWQDGKRQFNLYFWDEDIKGAKAFSYAINGRQPSTLESFMIDERKVTLDLMVLYTLQRLNGQKWLMGN